MFEDYKIRCSRKDVKPGVPYLWNDERQTILNFPSKNHWKDNSRLEWIEMGFQWIRENYRTLGFTSLSMPPVGCGNGGLYWSDVNALLVKYFADLDDFLVTVYLQSNASSQNMASSTREKSAVTHKSQNIAANLPLLDL